MIDGGEMGAATAAVDGLTRVRIRKIQLQYLDFTLSETVKR